MFERVGGSMIAALLFLSLAACGPERAKRSAVAQMAATIGHVATGAVTFTEVEGGIRVVVVFVGVRQGAHGFHIHEKGDCSSGDGTSAGDHWNPEGVAHGGRHAGIRHVGDLGNVTADADGVVRADFVDGIIPFDGVNSIIGKGFILHADEDDLTSQPSGAAGIRISCGVIESTNEKTKPAIVPPTSARVVRLVVNWFTELRERMGSN